jgi:hypothetical protein
MTDDTTDRDLRLEEARTRMSYLAIELQTILPAIDVAGLFGGALVGVLEGALGSEKASEYLAELATEIEHDRDGALHGHA